MLTRLKISGFKNLVDIDARFGPFTCIAGTNGVGKSNLFDAINFLSAAAGGSLMDAALSVRDEGGKTTDVRSLFHRVGDSIDDTMSFEAEMIVPESGVDDLGQTATASITFLRYNLVLKYKADDQQSSRGSLELVEEELVPITLGDAPKHLLFPHNASTWRKSAVKGRRSGGKFISTESGKINLHQDKGGGRPLRRNASSLPRTVLSVVNAAESPTALLARREMQSWRLLQLEPSSLRTPDEYSAPYRLGSDGSHLPATLNYLSKALAARKNISAVEAESELFGRVASRLSELIHDVRSVEIDRDERRELLTVQVTGHDGTSHPARALSDGTLRFLALAVLELDPNTQGLLCLEEPENGIHPERIPAMLQLLKDIANSVDDPVGEDNPLRQVIINTHSPAVVQIVPDDSLLFAQAQSQNSEGRKFSSLTFAYLSNTWRANTPEAKSVDYISKGKLLAYLNPVAGADETLLDAKKSDNGNGNGDHPHRRTYGKRVIDHPDMQLDLFTRES